MKRKIYPLLIFLCLALPAFIFAQEGFKDPKQSNVTGSDILADAPWRMKLTDESGNINSVPVHIFIKDANDIGFNAELIYLNIFIKNATDTSFGSPILFNTYSDSAFLALFSGKSQTDAALDIQSFDASLPVKDSVHTIDFTANDCTWPDECTYVDITHAYWYFTINIPADKLTGLDNIVDIRVDFSLNWQTDQASYVRVFRYDENLPRFPGWYRGDAHYHTMYTDNTAEFGLPLVSSKEAAKAVGLDWIASTNHSCDYDEYGNSIADNWTREKNEIQNLNLTDTSVIIIQAEEVSVNNSADNTIHLLCFPNPSTPYAMTYLGDGDGDLTGTSLAIDDILDTLSSLQGFAYAAHPFAGGDKLSSLVDGGIWNINDPDFFANGTAIAGNDVVICNDLASPSDVYSSSPAQHVFKDELKGGEIWNTRNAMGTTDEAENPWNEEYDSGITPFVVYDTTSTSWHWNRFRQGFEAVKFLNKKGLVEKNLNPSLSSYRFYFNAGSDAHGSFNYSNTDFVMGVTADVHDNAIGRPATLVYCPDGMGASGEHILEALQNGRAIISDGPFITTGVDLNNDGKEDFICGDEALPDIAQYMDAKVHVNIANTAEYGNIQDCRLIVGTQQGEKIFSLNVQPVTQNGSLTLSLDSLVTLMEQYDTLQDMEYFYLRTELQTHRAFGSQELIYRDTAQDYHALSNPLWIRKASVTVNEEEPKINDECRSYPNPFNEEIFVVVSLGSKAELNFEIFDLTGKLVYTASPQSFTEGKNIFKVSTDKLSPGVYSLRVSGEEINQVIKITKVNAR